MEDIKEEQEISAPAESQNNEYVATESVVMPEPENMPSENKCRCSPKKCRIAHYVFDGVLLIAVIVLYILHFAGGKEEDYPVVPAGQPGNGSVVYVNIDTINEKYEMVSLLTDSIEAEKQSQTVLFQNRQKALETKLANYQRNMQSGQLTAQQAQYAESNLQQESAKLQSDYAQAEEDFAVRYQAALAQIADSLKAATDRVNRRHNASYVFSYGAGSPMICADPTKDITAEVLKELNKPFAKKKHKGGKK